MAPKKPVKKPRVSVKAKATARSIVNINLGKTTRKPTRKPAPRQGMSIQTSPTIYSPAPTPFYVSNPSQSAPISSAAEIAQELRRLEKTRIETAIQGRDFMTLPSSALPSGSSMVAPQFNNMEVPNSFTMVEAIVMEATAEETKAKQQRVGSRMKAVERARSLGLSVDGTTAQINERIGAMAREGEIVTAAKGMIKQARFQKDI